MTGLSEPLDPVLEKALRRAVLEHALAERRSRHPAVLHLGEPGGREAVFAAGPDDADDHTLRTDVVAAMIARLRGRDPRPDEVPLVWLTRSGELVTQDVDAVWLAAARAAYDEAGLPLIMVVVNRHGWVDPRSGVRRSWVRLRRR